MCVFDVIDFVCIDGVVVDIEVNVGFVDVFVNNVGYGYEGILEEVLFDELCW